MGTPRQSPPSPELKIFSDRLQKALEFKKVDLAALAKRLGYKPDDIRRLLAGMREPSLKRLALLANSLDCSVDYLLGLAPKPQREGVVVEANADAIKPQSSECERTSGQISGKAERLSAMAHELFESDVELLMHIARFLIERKEKGLSRFVKVVRQIKKERERAKAIENSGKEAKGKVGVDDYSPDLDDDGLDEDELWGDDDDKLEEEELENDEDFEDDDDFDD
jgi:transcriptional regulator with XRE-family HTH domain